MTGSPNPAGAVSDDYRREPYEGSRDMITGSGNLRSTLQEPFG
jgi:hypothetical protein